MATTLEYIPSVDAYNSRDFSTSHPVDRPIVASHYTLDIPFDSLVQQSLPSEGYYSLPRGQEQPIIHTPAVTCFAGTGVPWTQEDHVYPMPASCQLDSGLTLATGYMLDPSQTGADNYLGLQAPSSDNWQSSPSTQLQTRHQTTHYETSPLPSRTLPSQPLSSSSEKYFPEPSTNVATYSANGSGEKKEELESYGLEAKRDLFLARNREAAARCRQKKRHWQADIEVQARKLAAEQITLITEVRQLRRELLQLKTICLQHVDCDCKELKNYLSLALGSARPNAAVYTDLDDDEE